VRPISFSSQKMTVSAPGGLTALKLKLSVGGCFRLKLFHFRPNFFLGRGSSCLKWTLSLPVIVREREESNDGHGPINVLWLYSTLASAREDYTASHRLV
jgi:hypothetical protein